MYQEKHKQFILNQSCIGIFLFDILFNIIPPFIQSPLKRKPEKLYIIRNMKHPLITLCMWTVKGARVIRTKRRSLLSSGVCLHLDDANLHTVYHTVKQIYDLKLEMSPHPPYSPDLDPTNFHHFWSPEDRLLGRNFTSVEEVKVAVCVWLAQQPKSSSVKELTSLWKVRRGAQCMVGTALNVNVGVLYLFLL